MHVITFVKFTPGFSLNCTLGKFEIRVSVLDGGLGSQTLRPERVGERLVHMNGIEDRLAALIDWKPTETRLAHACVYRCCAVRTRKARRIGGGIAFSARGANTNIPNDLSRELERVHFDTAGCGWPRAGDPPPNLPSFV